MLSIRVEHLSKQFGRISALQDLSLTIDGGELFFLLGPSGCGKTTLLRTLAGFILPDEGKIWFGDREVSHVPPHRRNTGMMFQSYALWPHLSVAENVAFGLEERRVPKKEIEARAAEALTAVRMAEYGARKPNELSGGQQQRVALARALIVRPTCLLLDEPLSNLDAKLRLEMRTEIRRVCKEFRVTTVYVTHDQKEALSIADRLAVLEAGRVLQVGTPREVYRRPRCRKVAEFIGEVNTIAGHVIGHAGARAIVETSLGKFEGVWGDEKNPAPIGQAVVLAIRPEAWKLASAAGEINAVRGRIRETTFLGEMAQYTFQPVDETAPPIKILELNPQPRAAEIATEFAHVLADDVVVLTE